VLSVLDGLKHYPLSKEILHMSCAQKLNNRALSGNLKRLPMSKPLTAAQALIYAMFTTSAADNSMNDAELRRIGSIVRNLPAFRHYDENELVDDAKRWGQIASGPEGLATVLEKIGEALPTNLRETGYILAAEVAASDLSSRPEERRFLQLLSQRLQLDRLTVAALERAALARHQQVLDS
jgi:tellurite resistance protein